MAVETSKEYGQAKQHFATVHRAKRWIHFKQITASVLLAKTCNRLLLQPSRTRRRQSKWQLLSKQSFNSLKTFHVTLYGLLHTVRQVYSMLRNKNVKTNVPKLYKRRLRVSVTALCEGRYTLYSSSCRQNMKAAARFIQTRTFPSNRVEASNLKPILVQCFTCSTDTVSRIDKE
jgi:hypothetical protein